MKIKILFLTKDSRGGMETFFRQMKRLDEKRFQKIFCYYKKDNFVKYSYQDHFINYYYPTDLGFTFEKLFLFLDNLKKTNKEIQTHRPDIIITCDVYSYI